MPREHYQNQRHSSRQGKKEFNCMELNTNKPRCNQITRTCMSKSELPLNCKSATCPVQSSTLDVQNAISPAPALWGCLDAALAWTCLPGNWSQPQAIKIGRLGTLPGAGAAWEAASKQPWPYNETVCVTAHITKHLCSALPIKPWHSQSVAVFGSTYYCCGWFTELICYERKILFHNWKSMTDSGL